MGASKILNYPIAYINHTLQNAPFFKPLQRGNRDIDVVIQHTYSNNDSITLYMGEQLDIKDEDLLLAILSITYIGYRGTIIDTDSLLFKNLKSSNNSMYAIAINTTIYELLKELSLDPKSSSSRKWLEGSLKRLKNTSFKLITSQLNSEYTSNLISLETTKTTSKALKVDIALNSYLCSYFLESDILKKGIISHNRQERVSMKKESARALHSYFNALVNIKSSRLFHLNTLVEKIYRVEVKNINKYSKSKKRKSITDGLVEINNLKLWEINFISKDLVKIIRK